MEADSGPTTSEEPQVTFNVKASNDQKYVITLPATTTIGELKAKLSTSEYADIPVERLRLIYSGRVLKDPDTLANTKIKDGHTIHLVKGAASNARQNPAAQSTSANADTGSSTPTTTPASNVPTNIAAGTGNNPLAALTGARYAGFHGLPSANTFGADGGMGAPPGPDEMLRMMEDPNFLQQMNEMMNIPEVQRMMEESPMLRDQPLARQMLRDPNMRRLMFDPRMLRMQIEMQRALGRGGPSAFPAPGVTDTTPQQQRSDGDGAGTQTQNAPTGDAQNPLAALLGSPPAGGAQGNPFAALFGAQPPLGSPPATAGTAGSPPAASPGPGATQNPQEQIEGILGLANALRAFQGAEGGEGGAAGAAANPFGGLFGMMPPQSPPDNRPPEERYADQLRQLNDMGFYEFERNIEALRRSGGSVQGAVEYLLGGGGT